MTKIRYIFLLLIIFSLNIYANSNEKLEKVTVQLHWKYQFEFAGFIAAKEKGFYKDVGLDVNLKEYDFGIDIEQDVLDGVSEYGIYNSYTLIDYLKGKDIVLISSFFKRAALVLVSQPDIFSPKDLVGKKIMASTKEDFILNFKEYFKTYGVSVDDILLVPHNYKVDDFKNKKISAMTAFVSDQLYKLDKDGIKYNVLDPSNDNLFALQMEMFTSKRELLNHPKRVQAMRKASQKGWQYALKHKKELVDIIYNKYLKNDTRKITKDALLSEADGIQKLILPYTYVIGSIDRNFLQKQMKLFKDEYKIGKNKNLDNFIYKDQNDKNLDFAEDELKYINNNPKINLCLKYDRYPFDGYQNGKFVGIMSDIFSIISNVSGLKFSPIISHSEKELQKNILDKKCKVLSVYATKSKRYPSLSPTVPFSSTHFTLISTLDKSFVYDVKALKHKKLLVELKSLKRYLLELYPYLDIQVIKSKSEIIQKVLDSKAYAFVALDEEADYIIDKYGYGKLKINGFLSSDKAVDISIGVQKDEPVLKSIIDKSLESISKEKIDSIFNSWRLIRYQESIDYSLVFYVLVVMLAIVSLMYYYQQKLKKFNSELERLVDIKTKELREINESLESKVKQKIDELIEKDEILTMQSKQAVMGEMISMIAHQWRQPLNMITLQISNLQIKHMMNQKISDEFLNKTLDDITDTIVYLADTVEDFKAYFRPDKEKITSSIRDIIEKSVNFVQPRINAHQIKLDINDIEDIEMNTYPNDLIQVVLNLLNNSIDAYSEVDTDDKYIKVYTKTMDQNISVYVEDNAGGIKKEDIKRLFEPYFSTKGKNGTGLGLYMSKMIIEKQFSGNIKVTSKDSKTIFVINIPIII